MARETPINAEVPAGGPQGKDRKKAPKAPKAPKPPRAPRQWPKIPLPVKLIGGAVVLAVAFIVAAILGGGGSSHNVNSAAPPVSDSGSGGKESATAQSTTELGYPAFATKNTTRVGGVDPAANAAGTALAVFPSTDDAQRPAAVTLVDEADPEAAIAASVFMSAPVRAPILISAKDEMPPTSVEALRALDPQGSADTKGAAVLAIGDAGAPAGLNEIRAPGKGAAATAAAIARLRDRLFGSPPEHVVIAPLGEPAFAMPAAAWAARSGDPVLFAGKKKLPKATAAALRRHSKVPAFVLGPTSAISSDVLREIGKIVPGVKRVSGEDPVANAIAFARYDDGDFGWNVNDPGHGFVVARGDEPLNAAAASPLSASGTWGPLLLTDDAGTLPSALRGYLLDVKPGYTSDPTRAFYNHVWVVGDQEAIEVGQQAEIDGLAELAKIGGKE